MKLHLKHYSLVGLLLLFLLGGLWQQGFIDLPPRVTYGLRLLGYKLSQTGTVRGKTTVKLDVPMHKQEHSLSCEVAALKMALSAHNINIPESELIKYLAFDKTPKKAGVWGDPDKGFVGNIDGSMPATGYGVYAAPIAELADKWTKAEVLNNPTPEGLAAELLAGNPIVVWGYFGRGQKLSWNNSGGKPIKAVNGEHARVVIGFTGDADGPDGFYLIDPRFGPMYWSTDKLLKNWEALDRMGVVVYPNES